MSIIDSIKNFGYLGGFGNIIFTVNPLKTMTFKDAEHSSSVEYAEHKIIGEKPKLEYIAENLDTVSLNIKLSSLFGVNPAKQLKTFDEYKTSGEIHFLVLGEEVLGEYVIESLSKNYKEVNWFGSITELDLRVSFKEYR